MQNTHTQPSLQHDHQMSTEQPVSPIEPYDGIQPKLCSHTVYIEKSIHKKS
jgi:hypothetical protein